MNLVAEKTTKTAETDKKQVVWACKSNDIIDKIFYYEIRGIMHVINLKQLAPEPCDSYMGTFGEAKADNIRKSKRI